MNKQSHILDAVERNGTNWSPAVAEAFRQIYGKRHQELKSTKYRGIVKGNISYGSHERNVLDVYSPVETAASPRPVMIYAHGGGLVAGDKVWYKDSLYANIGDYFASHGIVAVIINYRLVPDVTYPGGGEDIQMAREWVYHNISKAEFGNGDPRKVVLVGQSAGGFHIATNLYYFANLGNSEKSESKEPVFPPIAGIVYISTPFSFEVVPEHNQAALWAYYGTRDAEEIHEVSPIGLLEALPPNSPILDPKKLPCLIVLAQYDPQGIQDPTFSFIEEYRRRSPQGMLPEIVVVAGHNHISHVCSIGTEDDIQGRMLREFISKVCSK